MVKELCRVKTVEQVAQNVYVLTFISEHIASSTYPGQFVNIKTDEGIDPLLRRPFSVYYAEENEVQVIFNVIGKGTAVLMKKKDSETIDVLGPLGVPFTVDSNDYDTAVLVAGGLGVAPLPMLTRALQQRGKRIMTFLGSRTASMTMVRHLQDVHVATDDGSQGFHGNVIELTKQVLSSHNISRPRIFACGPTPMLRVLQSFVTDRNLSCQASLEGPMGCGFGICQGCPVELVSAERKYALMCKDGPTFDMRTIKL